MLAYLDPGAGSVLIAALTAGTAGVTLAFRMYRDRLLGFFSKKRRTRAAEARQELLGPNTEGSEERVDPQA